MLNHYFGIFDPNSKTCIDYVEEKQGERSESSRNEMGKLKNMIFVELGSLVNYKKPYANTREKTFLVKLIREIENIENRSDGVGTLNERN